MSEPTKDKAESIRQRLRNLLRERGEDMQFGLQRYAIERFLYRLGVSAHRNRFILKGAALFALWGGSVYRPTRDLDFTGYGSADEADVVTALREICQLSNPTDELIFDPNSLSAEPIRDDSEYHGLRIRLEVILGTSRIPIQIDIGFGNAIEPAPQFVDYPTLLDDPPPHIRTYPPEAVIAEKLHAMVVLGERNSRFKDFYDLHVLARHFRFDGKILARAISATFERRSTLIETALPTALTPRFFADEARAQQWRAYVTRNSLPAAPADFDSVGELIRRFLEPVWSALAENAAFTVSWHPGGTWNSNNAEKTILTAAAAFPSATSPEQQHSYGTDSLTTAELEVQTAIPLRRFKPYSEYKDSGVEWLGKIPEHWKAGRLKNIATVVLSNVDKKSVEGQETVRLCNYVDVYYNERITSGIEFMAATATPEQIERFQLRRGDVLVTKDSETPNDIAVPSVVAEDLPGVICGYHLAHIRPKEAHVNGAFLARAFSGIGPRDQFHIAAHGITRYGLSGDSICSGLFVVPPLDEQRVIVAFLDRETAQIDAMVAKKERLIELLQEKRTAVITRAVTKGLDPNVPMKDSGVEWLGKIPAYWEAAKMWRISKAVSGGTPSKEERGYWDGDIPWVSPKDMKRRFIDSSEDTVTEQALAETGIKLIEPPVVLIVVRGMILAHTFPVAIATVPVTINQDMKALRLATNVTPVFMTWVFEGIGKSLLAAIVEEAAHGTRAIRMDQWRNVTVPLPSEPEQHAITAFLDRETARIDALVAEVREAIDRLKELRVALIAAAVTGKIDVRGEVA